MRFKAWLVGFVDEVVITSREASEIMGRWAGVVASIFAGVSEHISRNLLRR